jgi:hypothetical protein
VKRLALLLVLPLAAPGPASAASEPGAGFASVSLSAVASGQSVLPPPDLQSQIPGELDVPYAASTIKLGAGRATSTVAWPGEVGANAGSALIALGAPPEAAMLNDPVVAYARTGSGQPDVRNDSLPGSSMESHARLDDVSALTSTHLVETLVSTAGRTSASSRVRLTGPTRATGEATSSVRDVTVAGVLHVGSVTSTANGWSDGTGAGATGSTVVGDLSVAGTGITVGPEGVTLAGNAVPAGAALDAVNQALAQAGVSLALGRETKVVRGGAVEYATGSLVVTTPMAVLSLGGVQLRLATTLEEAGAVPPETGAPGAQPPPGTPATGVLAPVLGGDVPVAGGTDSPLPDVVRDLVVTTLAPVSLVTGFTPWWVVLGLVLAAAASGFLRRLPAAVLPPPSAPCSPEDRS